MNRAPLRLEDLPHPETLWAYAGVFAVLHASDRDEERPVYGLRGGSLRFDDGCGNWSRLVRVEGGRALLVGSGRHNDTTAWERPYDLLGEAPDWVPWGWISDVIAEEGRELSFAYWWDGSWVRGTYCEDVDEDGARMAVPPAWTEDGAVLDLGDVFFDGVELAEIDRTGEFAELARYEDVDELVEIRGRSVMRAAAARELSPAVLDPLLTAVHAGDLQQREGKRPTARSSAGAYAVAAALGLTPGSLPPSVPAATARSPEHPVPVLCYDEWRGLVEQAMRATVERPRPQPSASPELQALVEKVQTLRGERRSVSVLAQVHDEYPDHPDLFVRERCIDDDTGELLSCYPVSLAIADLAAAEAHPEHGQWMFLEIIATAEDMHLERTYDSAPQWWRPDRVVGLGRGVHIGHLRKEMKRRSPDWHPAWAALLDDQVPYRGTA